MRKYKSRAIKHVAPSAYAKCLRNFTYAKWLRHASAQAKWPTQLLKSSLLYKLTVLAKEHALFHLTLKKHYEDTFRRHVAPHCLAPHCLVTPHFPVTPHFGAALFGATLFGDATFSCGATLCGATLLGDATFSCDATFWRHIVWRHIVWWRHIFLWRHILAPHSLATHCLVTPHWGVLRCIGGLEVGWNGLGWGLVVWAKMHPVRGVFLGAW